MDLDDFYGALLTKRANKRAERLRLDAEIGQLEEIIKLYEVEHGLEVTEWDPHAKPKNRPARAGSSKAIVLQLLAENPQGLSAAELIDEAARRGHRLNRGTVASFLSVEAKAGNLQYDAISTKYRRTVEAPPAGTGGASSEEPV